MGSCGCPVATGSSSSQISTASGRFFSTSVARQADFSHVVSLSISCFPRRLDDHVWFL